MPEVMKVGIIFKEQIPEFFNDLKADETDLHVELLSQQEMGGERRFPAGDFLAVFFPAEDEEMPRALGDTYPGAEIVAYCTSTGGKQAESALRNDGVPVVHFPDDLSVVRHLLVKYAVLEASRREIAKIRQRTDQMRSFLDDFTNVVESSWDVSERKLGMSLMLNRLLDRIGSEECVVYLLQEGATKLHRTYATGSFKEIDLFDHQANMPLVEGVLASGTPYLNNSFAFELKVPFNKEPIRVNSVLCVPLERRGEKMGVLEFINKRDGGFQEQDLNLVRGIADPLSVAIRAVSMFENAERLTITDDLTKLYNYRYLMQFLEAEVKRCLRYKKKVSLLFVDIDGFKRINDTFGHLVGSQALAEMGQVFRRILRETDVVGRYGGDEFVIVLPETPLNGALVIAERIRKKVEDYEFIAQNVAIRLTVSLGVANCPKHTLTAEGLIKKADAAMYRAKELSKNSIKVAV